MLQLAAALVLVLPLPLQAAADHVAPTAHTPRVLVPAGAVWRYLDDGSDQGTAWRGLGFDDAAWAAGRAELGYGDGDEATVVSFGPNANSKYTTTYFRRSFRVSDPTAYLSLSLGLVRDDGAIVYVNGIQVARSNMPQGTVTSSTFASGAIGGADEETFYTFTVSPSLLQPGRNQLAVEVHQANLTSSDISFDLELFAFTDPTVVRGPYLQLGTPTSIFVQWRTDVPTDSRVRYGTDPIDLSSSVDVAETTTQHAVELTGLAPDTRYFYSIGSTDMVFAGGDADHYFETAVPAGTRTPFRAWVIGDSGTADANAAAVRDAYQAFTTGVHTDLWLMLGDNAYNNGTDVQYQAAVFDMYPDLLRTSVVWPTRGNHENFAQVYFGAFTLPTAGEAGGLPSGVEDYYSFDYANVHFVCLDSDQSSRAVGGPMWTWLRDDLAATPQEWTVAFWHHPPYTKGSHDSDTEGNLVDMRENFLPLLEDAGVDLVLCGHSHSYERSFLLDGHHDVSSTFVESMKVDGGDGREDGDGTYQRAVAPNAGAVYCVAGCSGKLSGGPLDHPAMFHSVNVLGSVVLDVDGSRMDVSFLDDLGQVEDYFTIEHVSSALVYGCGVNPPDSMTIVSGTASIGDTLVLGVDNPLGTQASGAIPSLIVSDAPHADFPCGPRVRSLGMGPSGELLVDFSREATLSVLTGAPWNGPGNPVSIPISIPNDTALIGTALFAQGVLVDPAAAPRVRVAVTDAVELRVGP